MMKHFWARLSSTLRKTGASNAPREDLDTVLGKQLAKRIKADKVFCAEVAGNPFKLFVEHEEALTFTDILNLCVAAQCALVFEGERQAVHLELELVQLATLEKHDRAAAIRRAKSYLRRRCG